MIYLTTDQETRATTNRVMAAIEDFLQWWVFGGKLHEADLRASLGTLPRYSRGETSRETAGAK